MNRWILIGVAVVIVAVSFCAGLLVQRQYQLASINAAEEIFRDITGLDDPVPPAPLWEDWMYPDAESKGSVTGSELRIKGKLIRPAGRYAVFVTPDDFETVAGFYADKTGFENVDDAASSRSAVSSSGTLQGESNHLLDDFEDAVQPQKSRPVRVKCLIRRCPSYDMNVLINRADGENHTHILLLYDPKTETRNMEL